VTTFQWETREKWGALPPKNRRTDVKPSGTVIHWPGPGSYAGKPHSNCRAVMRAWQKAHMAKGSNDLEYGLVLCTHLRLMEGRIEQDRTNIRVGSNGTLDANYRNSSIQLMRGSGDGPPTDSEVYALAEATVWLRANGGWAPNISGHRDHVSTSCPGFSLYNRLGEIRTLVMNIEEGDMPLSDEDIERIAEAVAYRVNRTLGDYNAKGEPHGPSADNPATASTYLKDIRGAVTPEGQK
jgi:hypothetical protein